MSRAMHEAVESARFEEREPGEAVQQYLTFVLDEEVYGIPIATVAEIIGLQKITPVPDPRDCVKGVINLRGTVIPVIDVRVRLGMEPVETSARTCIVIVQLERILVGLLVDTIADVVDVVAGEIEPAPRRRGESAREAIVTGFVHREGDVKILIDLARLLDRSAAADGRPGDAVGMN